MNLSENISQLSENDLRPFYRLAESPAGQLRIEAVAHKVNHTQRIIGLSVAGIVALEVLTKPNVPWLFPLTLVFAFAILIWVVWNLRPRAIIAAPGKLTLLYGNPHGFRYARKYDKSDIVDLISRQFFIQGMSQGELELWDRSGKKRLVFLCSHSNEKDTIQACANVRSVILSMIQS